MSIATLTQNTRQKVVTRSSRTILKLVPETSEGVQATRRFFAIFVSSIASLGFLALLGINTLLAQDAFIIAELKSDAKMISDQREAIARKMEFYSSPQGLANQAALLGMSPSENPTFLDVSPKMPIVSESDGVSRG